MTIIDKNKIVDELNDTINNSDKINNEKRNYLGMSSIGDKCERRLWYQFRCFTVAPFGNRIRKLFDLGKYIELQIINDLNNLDYIVNDCQKEISDFNGLFCGHIDGIIKIYNNNYLLECKSSNSKHFNSIRKNGFENFQYYQNYYDQVQCYMGYLELEDCLIAIYCKDTSEIHFELIKFDKKRFEQLKQKAKRVILSEIALPQIIEEDKYYFKTECKWCDYVTICKDTEIYTMSNSDKRCINCTFYSIIPKGFRSACRHPLHPYFLDSSSSLCENYINLYTKMQQTPIKVSIDEVKEYGK